MQLYLNLFGAYPWNDNYYSLPLLPDEFDRVFRNVLVVG